MKAYAHMKAMKAGRERTCQIVKMARLRSPLHIADKCSALPEQRVQIGRTSSASSNVLERWQEGRKSR